MKFRSNLIFLAFVSTFAMATETDPEVKTEGEVDYVAYFSNGLSSAYETTKDVAVKTFYEHDVTAPDGKQVKADSYFNQLMAYAYGNPKDEISSGCAVAST